jgi:hypothetical protein
MGLFANTFENLFEFGFGGVGGKNVSITIEKQNMLVITKQVVFELFQKLTSNVRPAACKSRMEYRRYPLKMQFRYFHQNRVHLIH